MGGKLMEVLEEAKCRAGHTYARCVWGAVNLMACPMNPEATSS